jgi:ABC-type Fe3+-hydroxamate transport system substrate-binding protein
MAEHHQLNATLKLEIMPKKIVSIVPSQTELLHYLGLEEEVVGITKFCTHPNDWFKHKCRVGGTKNVNIEKVKQLNPDLILANKEENTKEDVEKLQQIAPVYISDITTLPDAYAMIKAVGNLVGKANEAIHLVRDIENSFNELKCFIQISKTNTVRCCYLIWQKPYMTIGADTYIHHIIEACNMENVFYDLKRYPVISMDDIKAKNPDVVLLSSEPFPFKQKHIVELQKHLGNTKIILVDGEMFSWYGSRLLHTPKYLEGLYKQLQG